MTMTDGLHAAPSPAPEGVHALAASPRFEHDRTCFAACLSGLYRTDDGGQSWHDAFASLQLNTPQPTTAVALSPDWPDDRRVFVGVNGGILRSADGGHTWQAAVLPPPPPLVSTLIVSPNFAEDGAVFAGTLEDGVFRSADRGGSWAPWNFGLLDLAVLCMAISPDFARDETIFAGAESGLFRSANGGRAWREIPFPTELAPVLSLALSPNFAHDRTMFAGTESSGLLMSTDEGQTWRRLGEHQLQETVNGIILAARFPAEPRVLVAASDGLLLSVDGGESWSDWKPGLRFDADTTAVVAPLGLVDGAPLLVGLGEGGILQVS